MEQITPDEIINYEYIHIIRSEIMNDEYYMRNNKGKFIIDYNKCILNETTHQNILCYSLSEEEYNTELILKGI